MTDCRTGSISTTEISRSVCEAVKSGRSQVEGKSYLPLMRIFFKADVIDYNELHKGLYLVPIRYTKKSLATLKALHIANAFVCGLLSASPWLFLWCQLSKMPYRDQFWCSSVCHALLLLVPHVLWIPSCSYMKLDFTLVLPTNFSYNS